MLVGKVQILWQPKYPEGNSKVEFYNTNTTELIILDTFQCPWEPMKDVTVIAFKRNDKWMFITTPYEDTADTFSGESIPLLQEGHYGEADDYSWWWENNMPDDLPINNRDLPEWLIEAWRTPAV